MEAITTWLKPPRLRTGLDHLGAQAPCIYIYGRLLPGITNSTNRARYYSFYPWILWKLEQEGYSDDDDVFIDKFRRADCLFTLIAEYHQYTCGDSSDIHTASLVGSKNLNHQIAEMREGKSIRLSQHTNRKTNDQYFQNRLGGLGQYYLSVLTDLNLVGDDSNNKIVEAMDGSVPGDLFLETLNRDWVSPEQLIELSSFCPCMLVKNKKERDGLCDILFMQSKTYWDEDFLARRQSLQLILHLVQQLSNEKTNLDTNLFRGCIYSRTLPNGKSWTIPNQLENIRNQWITYQTNELLSLAMQGLFHVLLRTYDDSIEVKFTTRDLAGWFVQLPEVQNELKTFGKQKKIRQLIANNQAWLPDIHDWLNENHEMQLGNTITLLCHGKKDSSVGEILRPVLQIIVALQAREHNRRGYGTLTLPKGYYSSYPINLHDFVRMSEEDWADLTLDELLEWLCHHWVLENHFQVALRKLRDQLESTFRIRPTDTGLTIEEIPVAVNTNPRFTQAFRILKDIGALVPQNNVWCISELGVSLMEVGHEA